MFLAVWEESFVRSGHVSVGQMRCTSVTQLHRRELCLYSIYIELILMMYVIKLKGLVISSTYPRVKK